MQGHIAATSPAYAHRLSSVFSSPDNYQPDRSGLCAMACVSAISRPLQCYKWYEIEC